MVIKEQPLKDPVGEEISPTLLTKVTSLISGVPAELREREKRQRPLSFVALELVEEDYVVLKTDIEVNPDPVGRRRPIEHVRPYFPEALDGKVQWGMTRAHYKEEGFNANAYYLDPHSEEKVNEHKGIIWYQPMKISQEIYDQVMQGHL